MAIFNSKDNLAALTDGAEPHMGSTFQQVFGKEPLTPGAGGVQLINLTWMEK